MGSSRSARALCIRPRPQCLLWVNRCRVELASVPVVSATPRKRNQVRCCDMPCGFDALEVKSSQRPIEKVARCHFRRPSVDMRGVKSLYVRVMDRLRASPTTTEGKELDSLHRMPPCERLHGRTTSFDHRACGRAIPTETGFSIVVQFRKSEDPNRRCDSPDSTESNDAP